MRIVFQQELESLQAKLVEIAELVKLAVTEATTAFRTTDVELAEGVKERAKLIDRGCRELDETAIDLLARQSPVASDLRLVVTALRISSSLERMGDLSQHIAGLTRYRFPERAIPKGLKRIFTEMGELDVEIAGLLVDILRDQDPKLFRRIDKVDDEIDELHVEVFEKVLSGKLEGDGAAIVDATLASRYHERFGDHAVSIAERIAALSED